MAELKIVSETPHSEEDITNLNPIKWKLGDIDMTFPCFSYRDYIKFNQCLRVLLVKTLIDSVDLEKSDIKSIMMELWEKEPLLKLHQFTEIGLPYYVISFAKCANISHMMEVYNKWALENIDHIRIIELTENSSQAEINIALAHYLSCHFYEMQLLELFEKLLYLQHNIKKKVLRFGETKTKVKDLSTDPRLSYGTRQDLKSIQRKRLRRLRSSSS